MQHKGRANTKGTMHCFSQLLQREGAVALYKGFAPYFAKEAMFNILLFCIYEKVKRVLRLD